MRQSASFGYAAYVRAELYGEDGVPGCCHEPALRAALEKLRPPSRERLSPDPAFSRL